MPTELPPALIALLQAVLGLARQSSTGRVGLARTADLIDRATVPQALHPVLDTVFGDLPEPEPLDAATVQRSLRDAWGRSPGRVLDDLDPVPLRVCAASQIHRGELDGRAVAVKVRRPGLDRALRADLALIEALSVPLGAAFPAMDAGRVLRDVREQALDELDLESEAEMQRRVARAVRHVDGVVVPRPHTDLAAPGVLVSELLDGPTLQDGGRPRDLQAAVTALVHAHVTAARDAGLLLLDARPSHLVALADGRVGLLGAGVARQVTAARFALGLEALAALRDDAPAALAAVAGRGGMLPAATAHAAHAALRAIAGPLIDGPGRLDAEAIMQLAERGDAQAPHLLPLIPQVAATPEDVWIARSTAQLIGLVARLGARVDLADVVLEAPAP